MSDKEIEEVFTELYINVYDGKEWDTALEKVQNFVSDLIHEHETSVEAGKILFNENKELKERIRELEKAAFEVVKKSKEIDK